VPEAVATLPEEVRHFHDTFFAQPLDQSIIDRYVAAHHHCLPDVDARSLAAIDTIVASALDVEAIELVFRLRRRDNVLSKKLQILFYIVEVRAQYYGDFVGETEGRGPALRGILRASLSTVFKFLKGKYLVWKFGLA
jgi:hypothetical protein